MFRLFNHWGSVHNKLIIVEELVLTGKVKEYSVYRYMQYPELNLRCYDSLDTLLSKCAPILDLTGTVYV